MSTIKKLRGGIWNRPIDTPTGPAGWYADIFWIERQEKHYKPQEKHFGPCQTLEEIQAIFNPEWEKIYDLSYRPTKS